MINNFLTASGGFGLFKTQPWFCLRNFHNKARSSTIWGKPDVGWIKLNVDGSSKSGTGKANIGGDTEITEGTSWLGSQPIGKATSSVAELVATKRGLELALENDWSKIWLEGDAKVVIDLLMNGYELNSQKDREHIREINMIIPQLKDFKATHIFRKGNTVAHKLAKMGHEIAKPQIWRAPPDEILQFLRQDAKDQHVRLSVQRRSKGHCLEAALAGPGAAPTAVKLAAVYQFSERLLE